MAFLIWPNNDLLLDTLFDKYFDIPFLISKNYQFIDDASAFLREKSIGNWIPGQPKRSNLALKERLSENTVRAYAEDLKNFVSYCERRRLDVKEITYQNLLETYDRDMGTGKWSKKGKPLASETINRRMRVACEYITWTADNGIRGQFSVPTQNTRRSIGSFESRRSLEVARRIGYRRNNLSRFRLPSRQQIAAFVREVHVRHGRARGTAVGFVFASGCRLEETVLLRADQVPDPDTVDLDKHGRIEIVYGAKGGRVPGDPSKAGKIRYIRIARDELVKLYNYKQLARSKAVVRYRQLNPGKLDPAELFLDERTGLPLSRQTLYRAWTRANNRPVEGKGVHTGRHCFACYLVLDILEQEASVLKLTLNQYPQSMLRSRVDDLISTHLSPVLGHVSEATTERYLDWLIDEIWVVTARKAYSDELDSAE